MKVKIVVSRKPIAPSTIFKWVANPQSGGLVFFVGTVRSESKGMKVTRMSLEAAEGLAKTDLARICKQVERKYRINDVAVAHRVGRLKVGDVIVAICVGAAHRKDAFKACEFIIDELKKTTPIWKKEIGPGRERWV